MINNIGINIRKQNAAYVRRVSVSTEDGLGYTYIVAAAHRFRQLYVAKQKKSATMFIIHTQN